MKKLFYRLPQNFLQCFSLRNLPWHILAILLTYILVNTDLDWQYYLAAQKSGLTILLFPAIVLGGILPIALPACLLVVGWLRKRSSQTHLATAGKRIMTIGYALGQAAILGSIVSSVYKAFTGRAHPSFGSTFTDITHVFDFGWLKGGIFWGWPSSHTTIAFAMSVAFITLTATIPAHRRARILAILYAFYVGIGVSVSIHWFSDFVAGAIIGSVIGYVVGMSFRSLTK